MIAKVRFLSLSWQLVLRNVAFQRTAWVALVTAFLEPALYFAAVVVGFSFVVEDLDPGAYAAFVGPALLAVSVMNGSLVECTNNVFYRLRQAKLYDAVICTAMSPANVVIGELMYGTLRGFVYGAIFLVLLIAVTPIDVLAALECLAAALLVGAMFAAGGLALIARVKSWRQLQAIQLGVFVMFLLSDTFVDLSSRSGLLAVLTHLFPLTYATHLMRAIVGHDGWSGLLNLSVIIAATIALAALAVKMISRELGI